MMNALAQGEAATPEPWTYLTVSPGAAFPAFCISLTWDPSYSSLREALLRFGKEQGRRGAVLADGSLGPACTPSLCLPPCESVWGPDTLTAGHVGNAVFSSWPSGSPQGSLSSGWHWPAIDFSSGLTWGLFFIFIPCAQRWLTWSRRGLGNKRSKGASI